MESGQSGSSGAAKSVKLEFKGVGRRAGVAIQRVDVDHGNTLGFCEKMGKPQYPTERQIESLRKESQLGKPEVRKLNDGAITLQFRS